MKRGAEQLKETRVTLCDKKPKTFHPIEQDRWKKLPNEIWGRIFKEIGCEWLPPIRLTCKLFADTCKHKEDDCDIVKQASDDYAGILTPGFTKWALDNGIDWTYETSQHAAQNGNLEVLKIIRNEGCIWNNSTFYHAAKGGHLHVLKWLVSKGVSDDKYSYAHAVRSNDLDLLSWFINNGFYDTSIDAFEAALDRDLIWVIQFMIECEAKFDAKHSIRAAFKGNLKVLKLLHRFNYPIHKDVYEQGIVLDRMDMLKWAEEIDVEIPRGLCSLVLKHGQFHMLEWAKQSKRPWDANTCSCAVKSGRFDVLKWCRENGAPWDVLTCAIAALGGHLDMLQWARENGCPWDSSTCSFAAKEGHLDVLKWARENGCPWDSSICSFAAENEHWDVLKWAIENGAPLNESTRKMARDRGIATEYL